MKYVVAIALLLGGFLGLGGSVRAADCRTNPENRAARVQRTSSSSCGSPSSVNLIVISAVTPSATRSV